MNKNLCFQPWCSNKNQICSPKWNKKKTGRNIWNNILKDTEHQATNDSDLWGMKHKQHEPYDCP